MDDDLEEKVRKLLLPLGAERCESVIAAQIPRAVIGRIAEALTNRLPPEQALDVGFHMVDWNSEAAFIVALLLFPEQFTAAEIAEGIEGFLVHAPNHIIAAAKLMGYPVADIFGVGALSGQEDDQPDEI